MMLTIGLNIVLMYSKYVSSFYAFQNGLNMGKAVTAIFVEFDKWAEKPIIRATKPWERRQKALEIEYTSI